MTDSTENEEDGSSAIVEPIDDPEDYVQQRRLKDIFDARKKVRERRLQAKQHQIEYENRPESVGAVRMYRTAIESYLSELRPLFYQDSSGKHYWNNQDIGTVEVSLPVVEETVGRGQTVYKYGDMKINRRPDPKKIPLEGIGCLFQLPEPIAVSFDVTALHGYDGFGRGTRKETTIDHETAIPFGHLDRIMNLANQYLSERGMEVDPEEETDPAKI